MPKTLFIFTTMVLMALAGCQATMSEKTMPTKSDSTAKFALSDQAQLKKQLGHAGLLNPDRLLAHLSHVCDLTIAGKRYSVVDLRELVKGANTPRGVNQILILDAHLNSVQKIEYGNSRPLFCKGNQLFLYGDLTLNDFANPGNRLTFAADGEIENVDWVEANDWF